MTGRAALPTAAFLAALRKVATRNSSEAEKRSFRSKYRSELAELIIQLDVAGLIGEVHDVGGVPVACSLCDVPFDTSGTDEVAAMVQGETRATSWAYMCRPCFREHGVGIGRRTGRLYVSYGEGWDCIAGGDRNPLPGCGEWE